MRASTLATLDEVSTVPVTSWPPVTVGELRATAMMRGAASGDAITIGGADDAFVIGDLLGAGDGRTGAAGVGGAAVGITTGGCGAWLYHSSAAAAASTIRVAANAANFASGLMLK